MTNKKQQGFVLALALLMMLFVGLIVITSTERTGQETRVSQSEAPIATLQAAAEAGLLTLRNKIETIGNAGGACFNQRNPAKAYCDCINNRIETGLGNLLGTKGYAGNEQIFQSQQGSYQVYWWFVQDKIEIKSELGQPCIITASIFVGEPTQSPGHFMTADILITDKPVSGTPLHISPITNALDLENFAVTGDLDVFYTDEFLNGTYPGINVQKLAAGTVLDPAALSDDKINFLVLDGALTIPITLAGKQLIIISKNNHKITFQNQQSSGSGGGAGAGGVSGWIIAPNAEVDAGTGRPFIDMNVISSVCRTGNKTNRCFHPSGGSSFNGSFGIDNFDFGDNSSTVNTESNVSSAENMIMHLDY